MANPSPSNSSRRSAPHPSRSGGGVSRPLYAIDFTAVACGKRIANTKRRVRWRFGFANPDALAAGETGTACRGEEHDVTMVWSVTSGKRLILADGQEVHYSNSRSAVIDFSWTMRGNHVLKVIAHATAPMSADPGFRQYDFFVDGRSFFTFPKVYRLGLSGSRTVSPRAEGQRAITTAGGKMAESSGRRKASDIAAVETPHNRDEEDAYLAEAIKASLEDQSAPAAAKSPEKPKVSSEAADLLIDFMDDWNATGNTLPPAPAPDAPAGGSDQWALAPAPVQNNQWAVAAAPAAPAADAWAQPAAPAFAAPPATPAYSAAPSNPFSPPPAQQQQQQSNFGMQNDPFSGGQQQPPAFASPQPSVGMTASAPGPFAAPSNVFSPAPPAPAAAAAAPVSQPPITSNGSMGNQQPPAPANVPLTMGNLSSDGLLGNGVAATDGSMADKALQNLMGSIDSFGITGSAAKPSNPFDTNNITNNQTLGEIKSSSPKKPVMNAAPPRAMVMSNNQSGNWGMGMQQQQQPQYGGGMGMQQQQYGGYPQQQQSYNMGMQGGMQQQPMQGGMQQPPPMQGGMPPQYGQQQPPQWGAQGPTY